MGKYQVSVKFDLTIEDETSARAFAKMFLTELMDEALLRGDSMKESDQLPEERVDRHLQSPGAIATGIGLGFVLMGARMVPPVAISGTFVSSTEVI